jgi:hypothetical protein
LIFHDFSVFPGVFKLESQCGSLNVNADTILKNRDLVFVTTRIRPLIG